MKSDLSTRTDLAPWWRRVVAELCDLTIVAVIASLLLFMEQEPLWWHTYNGHLAAGDIAMRYIAVDIAALLYYPVLVWHLDGQTIGKRLLQIRVIRADLHRMSLLRATWREVVIKFMLLDLVSILPIVGFSLGEIIFLANGLWPLWDRENRALHDMLARTRVIRVAKAISHENREIVSDVG